MKKIINLVGVFFIILFSSNSAYATTITLEQIAEKFNESSFVKDYADIGGIIKATSNNDSLEVEVVVDGQTENIEYKLEGNVLSTEIDTDVESVLIKFYVTMNMIDVIGQMHGYEEGQLLKAINSEEAQNYTLENEGFEIENIDTNKIKVKVDITKKIPLIDFSDTYFEIEDLAEFKDCISGDGWAEKSKGNVWFNKNGNNGQNTLLMAEKDQLTENLYKSLLSIIEVMFDSKEAVTYFKDNYNGISIGDKEFTGFKIEVNPTKTEFEESLIPEDSGYKFVRITIDKSLAMSAINGNIDQDNNEDTDNEENNNNTNNDDTNNDNTNNDNINNDNINNDNTNTDNTQATEKIPQAGKSMRLVITMIVVAIISIISYKKSTDLKI